MFYDVKVLGINLDFMIQLLMMLLQVNTPGQKQPPQAPQCSDSSCSRGHFALCSLYLQKIHFCIFTVDLILSSSEVNQSVDQTHSYKRLSV